MESPRRNWRFSDLVHPIETETFFLEYWERKCLHVSRGDSLYYQDILTPEDIDWFLRSKQLASSTMRVVADGKDLGRGDFARRDAQGFVDNEAIFRLFAEGKTIVINSGSRSIPRLVAYCSEIEAELGFRLQFNIYITPPGAQGFKPHYDDHDVFVLHVSGTKDWRLYGTPVERPSRRQAHVRGQHEAGEPQMEFTLQPGDLVYIPRGFFHEAVTSDSPSIHITFGLHPTYWFDLVREIAILAQDMPQFRWSIPTPLQGAAARMRFHRDFRRGVEALVEKLDVEDLLSHKADRFVEEQLIDDSQRFLGLIRLPELGPDSILRRRRSTVYKVDHSEGNVCIRFGAHTVRLPQFLECSLALFWQDEPFTVREIGGLIDDAGRIALVEEFVRKGFLEIEALRSP